MPSRKRGHEELELDEPATNNNIGLLTKLRNTWQMANLMQWLYLFGKEHKVDEGFDMEALEEECLKPGPSDKLVELGLSLLKHVSSNRGLTPDNFDEYTRRQYVVRRPHDNPFGEGEEPKKFNDFDVFKKLRVLHQLTIWIMSNPDRFRERMAESRDSEQAQWRIEEIGWDSEERPHFVLDDNRLYRRTPKPLPPPPAPKTKLKPKSKFRPRPKGSRTSKRRKVGHPEETEDASEHEADGDLEGVQVDGSVDDVDDGLGGDKWECLCVTLEDYQNFVERIRRSKDPNEKILYKRLVQNVMPIIEKAEEDRAKKVARRERELLTLEKLASAKRSSRIASRVEKEKDEQLAREADEKHQKELAAAREDAQRQREMDEARKSRMMTREQRLKDREYKRVLHEEELKTMFEEQQKIEAGEVGSKKSERHLKAEMKKAQEALEDLVMVEDEWVFDCSGCGVHGQNIDDGKHCIECERCNVWQHSACLGLSVDEAEKGGFVFVCKECKRKEEEAKRPKIAPLKFKLPLSPSQGRDDTVSVGAAVRSSSTGGNEPVQTENDENKKTGPAHIPSTGSIMPPLKKFKAYVPKEPANGLNNEAANRPKDSKGSRISLKGINGVDEGPEQTQPSLPLGAEGAKMSGSFAAAAQVAGKDEESAQRALAATDTVPRTPASLPKAGASSLPAAAGASSAPGTAIATPATSFPHLPPPQPTPTTSFIGNTPNVSFQAQTSFPSTPVHPLVPEKQLSAAPSPIAGNSLLKASPSIVPPASLNQEAKVSGISPVKNSSPPQPAIGRQSFGSAAEAPKKLQPSQ